MHTLPHPNFKIPSFSAKQKHAEMKDYHLQTPQKDHSVANRRSKSISDHRNKIPKIGKKSLSSEFSAIVFESPKDSTDLVSIADNSDENLLSESAENATDSLSLETSLALEAVASSDLTPLSSMTTSDEQKEGIVSTNQSRTLKSETVELNSVEAELVVKHLRGAQLQIVNATGMDLQSKRVLDALVNLVVEDFIRLPEEKDLLNELMARKGKFAVMSFLLWIIVVSAFYFFFSGSKRSFSGAIPT